MHVPPLSPPPSLLSLPSPFTRSPSSDLFLYSPVTYSAVGVFFNNERNVSSTSNSFHGGGTTCRDQTQELMPREMIVDEYDAESLITRREQMILYFCPFVIYVSGSSQEGMKDRNLRSQKDSVRSELI